MKTVTFIPLALVATVYARSDPADAPGTAATIAGAAISDLLGGADACDKLARGDQILAELGTGADAVAAAIGMVAAEKNFNPSAQDVPTVCGDPTLPSSEVLRGITPLVDPAVDGADVANALSEQTKATPLDATGRSVADLLSKNGFESFIVQGAAAGAVAGVSAGVGAADAGVGNATKADMGPAAAAAQADADKQAVAAAEPAAVAAAAAVDDNTQCTCSCACSGVEDQSAAAAADAGMVAANATAVDQEAMNPANPTGVDAGAEAADAAQNQDDANAGNSSDNANADDAGDDFGLCDPTMSFEGGRANRAADEFTFQSNDPEIAAYQQEALNPNIITNRICDELTNICGANDAAKATCADAQAQIEALGTRDQTTADAWNELVGGAGAASARKLKMRRTKRAEKAKRWDCLPWMTVC